MIKKILKNLSLANEKKDDTFSHSENILNLIEGIIVHENTHDKYVNILNELTTLCFENPLNFKKIFFIKNEKQNEKQKKIQYIVDRILIVLEKYKDSRNTFLYAITKLIYINCYNLNTQILRILCNIVSTNDEYKYDIYTVFEEIVTEAIVNSSETETLDNIFKGLVHLPKDAFIAGSFNGCIHKVIRLLKKTFNEYIFKFLSVLVLNRENCVIAYDEGLLKILTKEMKKHEETNIDNMPPFLEYTYLIVLHICTNYNKHCESLIKEKLYIKLYIKKVKEIIEEGLVNINKKKAIYCNIIILTLNSICKSNTETLLELCNTHHFIDLLLTGIKTEHNNPYVLSACLGGLLVILKNEETYKNNIEYILKNTNNLNILLSFLFGQKYKNILQQFGDNDNNDKDDGNNNDITDTNNNNNFEEQLFEIVKYTLDIIAFFFQRVIDNNIIKVKKAFKNSDINYYLLICLEKKNEEITIKLLKCIYLISFEDYHFIELHKIFYILHDKNIIINEKWKSIYYYCIQIYIKVIKNENVNNVLECYDFEKSLISILRITNQFLLQDFMLYKENNFCLSKKNLIEKKTKSEYEKETKKNVEKSSEVEHFVKEDDEKDIDLNKICLKLLIICSRNIDLRKYMRNDLVAYYFTNILSNENELYSELNIDYDILIERTWCADIDNIFKTVMQKKITKNKKVCFRLLIALADIFSGYFYSFKTGLNMNILDLCDLENIHWDKRKICNYFFLMNNDDKNDYKKQLFNFLNKYIMYLFNLVGTFIETDIFSDLKKEQQEEYFPGVLKYYILKLEKKIKNLKRKEKDIKNKLDKIVKQDVVVNGAVEPISKTTYSSTRVRVIKKLQGDLEYIHKKKEKLFLLLYNNNFKYTFDISLVEDEIECNIEDIFGFTKKVIKKKKKEKKKKKYENIKSYTNKEDLTKNDASGLLDNLLQFQNGHDSIKKNINNNAEMVDTKGVSMDEQVQVHSLQKEEKELSSKNMILKNYVAEKVDTVDNGSSSGNGSGNNEIRKNIKNENVNLSNYDKDGIHYPVFNSGSGKTNNNSTINSGTISSGTTSSSTISSSISSNVSCEDPNYSVLNRVSTELLNFNKEKIYEQKCSNLHILLFHKKGIFINSSKGEINEAYILYTYLRIFYSILINNINNDIYTTIKTFFLKTDVLKTIINVLNQCSFYDCNVYASFFLIYSQIMKINIKSVESMDMLIFYNIFFYYCKLLSKEFIKKMITSEYNILKEDQYFFTEVCQLFYFFIQKITYIQFSHYKEIQKWSVDCSLFHFFYKNNILLLCYLFIYINTVHHGSVYAAYIYHKSSFNYIHTIFFYTLVTLSYLMCFSTKLKYFIIYFINYKKYIHNVLFRKSLIYALFFYHDLIYLRILFQNQLSVQNRRPTQIFHISPVIYIRNNAIEWYFIALGQDQYYLLYIPDDFEENITEQKGLKLIIFNSKKYIDITRICMSKVNDNFFVFGHISYEHDVMYESFDMFISLNKYLRDEIVGYAHFLSGSDHETRVDLIQDNIFINNLKNFMNVNNIIITSFGYKEIKQSELEAKRKRKKRQNRKNKKEDNNIKKYEYSDKSETDLSDEYSGNKFILSSDNSDNGNASNKTSTSTESDDGTDSKNYDIFRRNTNNNKIIRILVFFVLTKNHLYIFKINYMHWIFLNPFIDEEKNDINLFIESDTCSSDGVVVGMDNKSNKNVFTNYPIYLNNFLGVVNHVVDDQNVLFARKHALQNTIRHMYSGSNTEYTNENFVLSTDMITERSSKREEWDGSDEWDARDGHNRNDERNDANSTKQKCGYELDALLKEQNIQTVKQINAKKRYLYANNYFLKIKHKYNNEFLSKIKFVNKNESIITLKYKIKHSRQNEKTVKMVMFDDYTRELWKRSLALSLNIQMTSSEWRRKWK
ncbi:conserved protein, unknown function [Hepatocystis sp. ex Piliocolobus tephrosceles]|nr:conserved protein, unknown function [Hepatocystis sp. ex Piliocolobus tephrosceles]